MGFLINILFALIVAVIGFLLAYLFILILIHISKDSPEMKRKIYIKKMSDAGFKRNEFGHWVKK